MPVSPLTVKVTWTDGSTSEYVVAEADIPNIVKGEIVVKLKGKKDGESEAHDYEITRANTKDIRF